jgi:type IV fimbrial biogenesis protein FimT
MQRHFNEGFSLLRFTLGLSALAISAMLAAPMYYKMAHGHWATTHANELVATLNLARSQAVTRGRAVSVCSSSDGLRCTDTPWQNGYIVFQDDGVSGTVDAGDVVLKRHQARKSPVTITLNGRAHVQFNPSGSAVASGSNAAIINSVVAQNEAPSWLQRLSPLGVAHASDNVARFAGSSSTGLFTVCAGRSGREVRLSPAGSVSTSPTVCQ